MRAILLLMPLLLLGAAPAQQAQPGPTAPTKSRLISPTPNCENLRIAGGEDGSDLRRLGQLPPADAYQAVYRLDEKGCIDPLLVLDRLRGPGRR